MNKPELIKRIAKEMTYFLLMPIMPTNKDLEIARNNSIKPDFYEHRIPFAEVFIEQLIEDGVIDVED